MKRSGFLFDFFSCLWSPSAPLAGAMILAVAGVAPVLAAASLLPTVLALPLVLGVMALVLWAGSSLGGSLVQEGPGRVDRVRMYSSRTSRKSIYDLETGFCAEWYFHLRVEEEVARTMRSEQAFGLLLVEPRSKLGTAMRTRLLLALERAFRAADLVGRLDDLRFGVLLPDSDHIGTSAARDRLQQLVGRDNICLRMMVHPHGGSDWRAFLTNEGADTRFPSSEPIWTPGERSAFDRE